jgi:hypothetical protein
MNTCNHLNAVVVYTSETCPLCALDQLHAETAKSLFIAQSHLSPKPVKHILNPAPFELHDFNISVQMEKPNTV